MMSAWTAFVGGFVRHAEQPAIGGVGNVLYLIFLRGFTDMGRTAGRLIVGGLAALTALGLVSCDGDDDAAGVSLVTDTMTASTEESATNTGSTGTEAPVTDDDIQVGGPRPTLYPEPGYQTPDPVYVDPAPAYEAPAPEPVPGCADPMPINGGPGDGCGGVRPGLVNPNH
jgi:hypothetical protein